MSGKVEMLMERLDVTRKGAQRIANIMEAGVDILRSEGFTALTKRRIAKRLGISDGNVSYYFPTRESLWKAVIEYEVKTYYDRHFLSLDVTGEDPDVQLELFVDSWFREYEDRNLRSFFAQLLAYAEVSEFVAQQRDEIYQRFFDQTYNRIQALDPKAPDDELRTRSSLVVALLEGMHAVTAVKPEVMSDSTDFNRRLVEQVKALARGR